MGTRRFEFRILCSDRDVSCTNVKSIMQKNNFEGIRSVGNSMPFDHVGIISLPGPDEALAIKRILEQSAGDSLRSVEIAAI